MTKYKHRSAVTNQRTSGDWQLQALKPQGNTSDSDVPFQESLELDVTGVKPTDSSRIGDMAEHYAITWLWDNGYQVFRNCGCTGPVDLVAMAPNGDIKLLDVKSYKHTNLSSRTPLQKELGVQYVHFNSETRKMRFVEHRE